MSGPVSVLYNSDFSVSYAAKDELTTSQESATIKRDISLAEAKLHLSDYEILIVPGSRPNNILPHMEPEQGQLSELVKFIACFASDTDQDNVRQRTILAVCIGAYLLASGLNQFGVRIITTGAMVNGIDAALHFISLGLSRSLAIEVAEIMGHRWKDI